MGRSNLLARINRVKPSPAASRAAHKKAKVKEMLDKAGEGLDDVKKEAIAVDLKKLMQRHGLGTCAKLLDAIRVLRWEHRL